METFVKNRVSTLISIILSHIISELTSTQKNVIWENSHPKLKHGTLGKERKNGGLKNVNILSLQKSFYIDITLNL